MSTVNHLTVGGLLALFFLSACSLAPEYYRPEAPVPKVISAGENTSETNEASTIGWKDFFQEPQLLKLIGLALENNRDLKLAGLRILEARAKYGITNSERWPMLEAEGNKTVTGGPTQETRQRFEAMINIPAFELDFFGRISNMSQAALEEYLATEEAEKMARLSLVGEVAMAYLDSRLARERLRLNEETLQSWKSSMTFIEKRILSGQASLLELEQARSMVDFTEVGLAKQRTEITRADNALKLLLGLFETLELPPAVNLMSWQPLALPGSVPSTVLLKRPDVLEAEHRLKATHADIGAARAAFFPKLSLTDSLGFMSGEIRSLFSDTGTSWSFIPNISLPIFSGGRNRANLELAEVMREQAIIEYEKAIQTAFREVADSLMTKTSLTDQFKAQEKYLATQRRVLELASNRYQNGVISYLEVLDAQRAIFEAQMNILDIRYDQLLNEINLYKSLGGGLIDISQPRITTIKQ